MSDFDAPVVKIRDIEPIEGADRIALARVGDYRSVIRKDAFQAGDLAVYIPEAAIVPEWLLRQLGLWDAEKNKGRLAGSQGDRVKATRLRGTLSQGLLYPVLTDRGTPEIATLDRADKTSRLAAELTRVPVAEGTDAADLLGLVKWEPEIPAEMLGEVCSIAGKTLRYDIENLKRYPDVLAAGEPVRITEKLHGVMIQIGLWPGLNHPDLPDDGELIVASKGLGAKGLVFMDVPENADNVYLSAAKAERDASGRGLAERLRALAATGAFGLTADTPVFLVGELYGEGIQDLGYGARTPEIRFFDVFVGTPQQGRYLDAEEKDSFLEAIGAAQVPVLYDGPWDRAEADRLCAGRSTLAAADHIREGVVITPKHERVDPRAGRVILKHVSEAYLTRKGGTEYA